MVYLFMGETTSIKILIMPVCIIVTRQKKSISSFKMLRCRKYSNFQPNLQVNNHFVGFALALNVTFNHANP